MAEEGTFARFNFSDISQLIRIEVSERLYKRIIKKVRKQEEEDMGLVGIIIGFIQLAMLPITIPISIICGILRMFGIGKKKRVLFAFIEGPLIDLKGAQGILSRIKKSKPEQEDKGERTLYLLNIPVDSADVFQSTMESQLNRRADFIDDRLAQKTIWRDYC